MRFIEAKDAMPACMYVCSTLVALEFVRIPNAFPQNENLSIRMMYYSHDNDDDDDDDECTNKSAPHIICMLVLLVLWLVNWEK